MNVSLLTDDQLVSVFDTLCRRIYREAAGGDRYGVDLPTLRAVSPILHQDYLTLRKEGRRRTQERRRRQTGLA